MVGRSVLRTLIGLAVIALLIWSMSGCTAAQIDGAAAYLHGRVDELRLADVAKDRAKRTAAKRVHCRTSLPDFFSMPQGERAAYAVYCGYPLDWTEAPAPLPALQ